MIFENNMISMSKRELVAMLAFASKDDEIRKHLCGVLFQKRGVCASTDGHRLASHASYNRPSGCDFKDTIVPRQALELALKSVDKSVIRVKIKSDGSGGSILAGSSNFGFQSVDAKYPPFQHLLSHVSKMQEPVDTGDDYKVEFGFNAQYLEDVKLVEDAANEAGPVAAECKLIGLWDPLHIFVGPSWRVLVMPMRS